MYLNKTIAVVVPTYNEEKHIEAALNNIPEYVDIIYAVDDGSTDNTREIMENLAKQNNKISVITKANGGVGSAIVSGYMKSIQDNIDIVAVMAGDNQMDPTYLATLLGPVAKNQADYAKAERMSIDKYREGMSSFRRVGNWLLRWLTRIAAGNFNIMDPQAGYTAISSRALNAIEVDKIYSYYGYCNDILVRLSVAKARILEIPMPYINKVGSKDSKIRYSRYIPKVSFLLLRLFFWRIGQQLIVRGK
jgi:glycosyltransferase involved in cell wall biosynthesis